MTYREGHCLAYGSATPYLPVRALLRQHCGITEADGPEAITAHVCRAVQDAEIASEEGEALLLQLLDVPMETVPVAQLSPQAQRTRTFALLRRCFYTPVSGSLSSWRWRIAIGSTRPEEWLTTLIARLSGTSILLLVTYRPGYRPPLQQLATQIALPRLVPQDSLAVVQSVAQSAPLPAHLAQALWPGPGAIPFF